ncbi:MAG: rhodanese-like domain-containing protein [Methanotrichaceae archaeon]|nr:rhodanese-like domain-containing protein [Methanotrichaceae archaeon]
MDLQGWFEDLIGDPDTDDMVVPVSMVEASDVILDVGSEPEEYILGAVHIPYTDFMENNSIKPLPAIADLLGSAGISQDDSVLLYGECLPCGGGPSTATFVYWIMRYAGHDRVGIIDGGLEGWKMAGRPTQSAPSVREATNYALDPRQDLLASSSYVRGGEAQLIDARQYKDYLTGTIPGAINIPYDSVIDGERLKERSALAGVFSSLSTKRPVVVFTTTGVKASVVWFALTLLGYDARLYTYKDWYDQGGPIYLPETKTTVLVR